MFFSNYIYNWLDNALDMGISEQSFWDMTLAELERAMDSKRRQMKLKAQYNAQRDYILGDLIGHSIARLYGSENKYPSIQEVYPNLFNNQEIEEAKAQKQAEVNALRFRQFANSFNKRFQEDK